ncbi:acetyltransferase [Massilia sp. WF1]|uniref:GNAT family N-acetyltransferase n=1 Tax=unclassified Massilia TaxID=2609279 RepID=UPI00068E90E3|nr:MULTISPECIES: GNAT family N-acetyltransferase [unclassified Massilia]ALK95159.1 acetyltransferase [Massilia sp. WG5]KNZ67512.1 acetyltransferase [Massilia sp. WF1]
MITWQWNGFADLTAAQLYAMLALRQEVFVLEQACLYPDIDGLDPGAHHLLGWRDAGGKPELAAHLRCLAPGAKYEEMSIGRVVTSPAARGGGLGRELVAQGIALARQLHPGHAIRIGAQAHLERFYAGFGFVTVSDPYDEDGILHIDMLLGAA